MTAGLVAQAEPAAIIAAKGRTRNKQRTSVNVQLGLGAGQMLV